MQRSLRFSFFFRRPTCQTPFLTSPLKVKRSWEQVSLRKPLDTLHSLPHCFSLRSFSSFNKDQRYPRRDKLFKKRSQSPTRQTREFNRKKLFSNLASSFHSAMVKEDMEQALRVIKEMKENNGFFYAKVLKSIAVHLSDNDQQA